MALAGVRHDVDAASTGENGIIRNDGQRSGTLKEGNGTTKFGYVPALLPVGRITANKYYRPCGQGQIAVAPAAVNTITLDSVLGLFVGDVVDVVQASDDSVLAATRNVTAVNTTAKTVTLDGVAITAALGDRVQLADGSQTAFGLLVVSENTAESIASNGLSVQHSDRPIQIIHRGVVQRSAVPNLTDKIEADLKFIQFVDAA